MNRTDSQSRLGFHPLLLFVFLAYCASQGTSAQQASPSPRVLGTVQAINGKSLTILSDSGTASAISIEDGTKLLQIEPGKTDLKEAIPLALGDLQPGDRVLVRGTLADDGKTLRPASLIAMKKAAISEKQNKERAEWQRGIGGLVKAVDPAAQTVVLITNGNATNKEITLYLTKETALRRYAPDSTRFDAAKLAPLSAVQVGDQLRARGTRSADGASFDAAEVVSGTFRNVAGTVTGVDVATSTIVVQDLGTKSSVTLKVGGESQMRKLPPPVAERLAARLKDPSAGASGPPSGTPATAAGRPQAQSSEQSATPGGAGTRTGGDFQQMLARMPGAALADLQKGDVVMVVTTQGTEKDPPTVVTLLAGVEPILRASPKGGQDTILSPWTLGGGEPSPN